MFIVYSVVIALGTPWANLVDSIIADGSQIRIFLDNANHPSSWDSVQWACYTISLEAGNQTDPLIYEGQLELDQDGWLYVSFFELPTKPIYEAELLSTWAWTPPEDPRCQPNVIPEPGVVDLVFAATVLLLMCQRKRFGKGKHENTKHNAGLD